MSPIHSDYSVVISEIDDHQHHAKHFTGFVRYVKTDGLDSASRDGFDVDTAFATILYAISRSSAGDAITVKAGTYDEDIDLNLVGLELWCEIGVILVNTGNANPCVTMSANSTHVLGNNLLINQAGVIGILVSGMYCKVCDTTALNCTVGFDIDGTHFTITHGMSHNHTVTGFDISSSDGMYDCIHSVGRNGDTRGIYLSAAAADRNYFKYALSSGNATAGFEVVAGASYNAFKDWGSGGGDGARVDAGTFNLWVPPETQLASQHHEHILPSGAGEGVAGDPITVNNTAGDQTGTQSDQNFWGDIKRLINMSVLTGLWRSIGIYIYANTAAKISQWQVFFPTPTLSSAKSGGNDWDEGETALTVEDGTVFLANDLAWATGVDHPDGEIVEVSGVVGNVVTIARETVASARTGLRWNYDGGGGGEMLYVVYRAADTRLHGFDGDFSAGSTKDFLRIEWHDIKELPANSGMVMRMLSATDNNDCTFDVRAIYED